MSIAIAAVVWTSYVRISHGQRKEKPNIKQRYNLAQIAAEVK